MAGSLFDEFQFCAEHVVERRQHHQRQERRADQAADDDDGQRTLDFATKLFGVRVNIWTALVAIVGGLAWLFWRGSPVDGEATERLRAGTTVAAIIGGEGVRPPLAADTASAAPPEDEDELAFFKRVSGKN